MKSTLPETTPMLAAAGAVTALGGAGHDADGVAAWITQLRNPDPAVSGSALESARKFGAAAVEPLAAVMADGDFEAARKAKRALYFILRHAGRPRADKEAKDIESRLNALLQHPNLQLRRDVLWMLSEIGSDHAVKSIAAQLTNPETAEDARCALLRLPGKAATAALRSAFASASEPFKFALADALRRRGEKVHGYASQKLVPSKETTVVPLARKAK